MVDICTVCGKVDERAEDHYRSVFCMMLRHDQCESLGRICHCECHDGLAHLNPRHPRRNDAQP